MVYIIRRIQIWSVVRIAFFICAILGFLGGLLWGVSLWILSSVLGAWMPPELQTPQVSGGVVLLLAFVLGPVYGVFGALAAAVGTGIYNAVGKLAGGIEIELETKAQGLSGESSAASGEANEPAS